MKAQEIVNLILTFVVATLLVWSVMRESVADLWQRRQIQERIIQAVNDIDQRVKKLEGGK